MKLSEETFLFLKNDTYKSSVEDAFARADKEDLCLEVRSHSTTAVFLPLPIENTLLQIEHNAKLSLFGIGRK